jgi:hypothetical protein
MSSRPLGGDPEKSCEAFQVPRQALRLDFLAKVGRNMLRLVVVAPLTGLLPSAW